MNKPSKLQAIVYVHSPLIIRIAESWCTRNVGDAQLHLQGYNLFWNDRQTIHQDLAVVPCKALNDVGFDNLLWSTISLPNN